MEACMQELDSTHISIVVPCYNEEVSLPRFLEEITKTMSGVKHLFPQDNKPFYELIFVNDGSKDKTLEILHNMQKTIQIRHIVSMYILFRAILVRKQRF